VSPHNAKSAIRVRHLCHRFGPHDVLRDVSFDVGHGEIFGFIGPNGAGKTTTIRVMTTLLEPLAGRVEIDGYDVSVDQDKVRRLIGYMPDHAGVYERVTVREYLEFFADAYGVSSGGTDYAVVDAVLELTDLAKLESKLVVTMSKGMKQRLQLGRVLLHDPKVLILDEPASDLDPRARIEMRDLLVELRSMGKTIFLSSHILTELADVCTSVAILERGQLVVSGPISEIAERLKSARAGKDARAATSTETIEPSKSTRILRLRVLATEESVRTALRPAPFVAGVGAGPGGSVAVTFGGDDHSVAEIVKLLVAANIPVCGVEPERNELERIFLEVTNGDLQ
jgi:ABC-2 type transport system ATP-binding protein